MGDFVERSYRASDGSLLLLRREKLQRNIWLSVEGGREKGAAMLAPMDVATLKRILQEVAAYQRPK